MEASLTQRQCLCKVMSGEESPHQITENFQFQARLEINFPGNCQIPVSNQELRESKLCFRMASGEMYKIFKVHYMQKEKLEAEKNVQTSHL